MEYTALRQLRAVKDWLGETRIERDEAGVPTEITDHKGRTVSYEWGSMGERRSITYPDGRKALYEYDGLLRLQKMQIQRDAGESGSLSGISLSGRTAGRPEEINYKYDEMGRLSEKLLPEGMRTRWLYDERGQLRELVHEDRYGVLDRYQYEYDLMGNKTAITKERRGLKEESGRYEYGYDSLSRLASVSKDGDAIRAYAYDSFGNRSSLEDFGRGRNTFYHYDALNRLMYKEEGGARTDYGYDKRGNLVREEMEGKLLHGYEYGAMNRLSKSWNDKGGESLYLYNGLGQRMGRSINGREEDYLLDLTKPYHNLMEIYKGEECSQRFYLDGAAAAVEEASKIRKTQGRRPFSGLHYYLQDELGSPVRVSGYGEKESAPAGRNNYLTYGYDEFGNDPGEELEEAGIPNPYDRQGMEQPLGYTGYRYDEGSGTYFAQAREYLAGDGRFIARDMHWNDHNCIYGDNFENVQVPNKNAINQSTNLYVYCMNNAIRYTDLAGCEAGDKFKSRDDAAIDFAETTGGKSIEENLEYGTYIYSWEEEETFLFFFKREVTYYSYTEPFQGEEHSADFDVFNSPIPENTRLEAMAHTHGVSDRLLDKKYDDNFSIYDTNYADFTKIPFYLAAPDGSLRLYDPTIVSKVFRNTSIIDRWKLPHDKNHPELPFGHKNNCENCYAAE